jgi:hypothetical protein
LPPRSKIFAARKAFNRSDFHSPFTTVRFFDCHTQ